MKLCRTCGEQKPLEEFHRLAKSKDGRQPRCKACVGAYMREYHERNAEKIREKARAWRQDNPERKRQVDAAGYARRRAEDLEGERRKVRERARAYRAKKGRERSDTFCECGCGERTFVADEPPYAPRRFVTGHNKPRPQGFRVRTGPDYLIEDRGYETPCWTWQHGKNGGGYAQVQRDGQTAQAHRVFYEAAKGPISAGLELHHLCEQKACVNPDHLTPLTRLEHRRMHTR